MSNAPFRKLSADYLEALRCLLMIWKGILRIIIGVIFYNELRLWYQSEGYH